MKATDRGIILSMPGLADPSGYEPPRPIPLPDGGTGCGRCGVTVHDWRLHLEYHRAFVEALTDIVRRLPPDAPTIID